MLWTRTYPRADGASELALGPDGKLYVGGRVVDKLAGDQVCVVRYSPDGTRDWVRIAGYGHGEGHGTPTSACGAQASR